MDLDPCSCCRGCACCNVCGSCDPPKVVEQQTVVVVQQGMPGTPMTVAPHGQQINPLHLASR